MIKKYCLTCNKSFIVGNYYKNAKYCSIQCYWKSLKGNIQLNRRKRIQKICPICGKTFEIPKCRAHLKTCSARCGYVFRKSFTVSKKSGKRIKRKCLNCGKEYVVLMSSKKNKKFCSRDCFLKYKTRNVKYPDRQRYETKNWIINRQKVKNKYNNICQLCGANNVSQVHHKVPYSISGNNDLSNLTLLCKSCHLQIHKIEWENNYLLTSDNTGENLIALFEHR